MLRAILLGEVLDVGERSLMVLSGGPKTGEGLASPAHRRRWAVPARVSARAPWFPSAPMSYRFEGHPAIRKPPALARLKSNGPDALDWQTAMDWEAAVGGPQHASFLLRAVTGDFVFEGVNPAFEASTGLVRASVVGRALHDVLPEAIAADLVDRCRHCLSHASQGPFIRIMPLPEGRILWELTLTPRVDESGAVVGVCGVARKVVVCAELRDDSLDDPGGEDARMPNIHFTALPDGRVEWVDPSALTIAGLPFRSRAAAIADLVCPEDLARLTPSPDREQVGAAYETDVRLRGAGGRYRWFRVRAELVDGMAGRRWYGVAIDIDVARKRRAHKGVKFEAPKVNVLAGFDGCSVTIDRAWRITSLTPEAAAWLGVSEAELLGVDCRERLPIPKALIEAVETSLADQAPLQIEISAPDRPDRWMAFQIHPFAAGASIVFRDITEQQRGDQPAHPAVEWSLSAPDASTTEMALLDRDGVIVSVNAVWRASIEELRVGGPTHGVGTSYLEFCKIAIPDLDEFGLATGMSEVIAGNQVEYAQPYVIATSRGLWWRRLRILLLRLEPSPQLVAIHEDITDVGQARAALRNPPEQILSALAHERERIAFELHDSTSQHLAALGLGLIRLKRLAGDRAADLIADMSNSVQEMVREIRVLSYLMKPAALERDDLVSAARLFVSGFGARTGLNVEFRTQGAFDDIADTVQNAAFRILQEALSNVYRHADASRVEVDLTDDGDALHVRIADDGRGISLLSDGQLTVAPGVGFASMESRVAQLGGTLNISRGEVGTIVEASIPAAELHS